MAALGWLLNLDFAASEAAAPTGATALMALNRRRGTMYPPLVTLILLLGEVIGL